MKTYRVKYNIFFSIIILACIISCKEEPLKRIENEVNIQKIDNELVDNIVYTLSEEHTHEAYETELRKYFITLFNHTDIKESLKNAKYFDSLVSKLDLPLETVGFIDYSMCKLYINYGDIENAISRGVKALEISKEIKDEDFYIKIAVDMAAAYIHQGNYNKGLQYNIDALKKIGDANNKNKFTIIMNIGICHYYLDDLNRAEIYFDKARQIADKKRNEDLIIGLNLIDIYNKKNNEVKVDSTFKALTNIVEKQGGKNLRDNNYTNIKEFIYLNAGIHYYNKRQYDLAKKYLKKAEAYNKKDKTLISIYQTLGNIEYKTKNREAASKFFNKSDSIIYALKLYNINSVGALKSIAKFYEEELDFKNALEFHKKYKSLNDSIFNIEKQKAVENLTIQYEVEETALKNKSLLEKNLLQKQRLIWLIVGLFFLLVTIGLLTYLFIKQKRTNKLLFEQTQQMLDIYKSESKTLHVKSNEQKTSKKVPQDTFHKIETGLTKLIAKEFYLMKDCTLVNVSKKISTNSKYLSIVVRELKNKSFIHWVNELRIKHAIVRLNEDATFRNFDLQSMANELGYKERKTFVHSFKKITGISPTVYIAKLKK